MLDNIFHLWEIVFGVKSGASGWAALGGEYVPRLINTEGFMKKFLVVTP